MSCCNAVIDLACSVILSLLEGWPAVPHMLRSPVLLKLLSIACKRWLGLLELQKIFNSHVNLLTCPVTMDMNRMKFPFNVPQGIPREVLFAAIGTPHAWNFMYHKELIIVLVHILGMHGMAVFMTTENTLLSGAPDGGCFASRIPADTCKSGDFWSTIPCQSTRSRMTELVTECRQKRT